MRNDYEIVILGQNLRRIRKAKGLSIKSMAKILSIGARSLSLIESGFLPPRLNVCVLFKIYSEFGVSPSEVFSPLDYK